MWYICMYTYEYVHVRDDSLSWRARNYNALLVLGYSWQPSRQGPGPDCPHSTDFKDLHAMHLQISELALGEGSSAIAAKTEADELPILLAAQLEAELR